MFAFIYRHKFVVLTSLCMLYDTQSSVLCTREWSLNCTRLSQEELPAILKLYEYDGYFDEVISLLEAGLSLERAHVSHIVVQCKSIAKMSLSYLDGYFHRAFNPLWQI